MNKRRMYTIGLTVLLLGVIVTTYGVWTQSTFSHGVPGNDHGCYCHNGGIAVWYNGTDSGLMQTLTVSGGASFVLNVTSANVAATGVVPGMQEWMSNMTDNAKFTFSPQSVTANSTLNLSKANATISAFYKITAPQEAGSYTLTAFLQGSNLEISVDVASAQSTSTTVSTTSSTGVTTQPTSSTSTSSTSSSTASTTSSRASSTSSTSNRQTTTQSATSTTTSSSSMPMWAYGTIAALLIAGVVAVYFAKKP